MQNYCVGYESWVHTNAYVSGIWRKGEDRKVFMAYWKKIERKLWHIEKKVLEIRDNPGNKNTWIKD